MKLARVSVGNRELFVTSDTGENWRSLDVAHENSTGSIIRQWHEVARDEDRVAFDVTEFLSPVTQPEKVICVGLNYRDHIRETGATEPEFPVLFAKYPNALTGAAGPVIVDSRLTEMADYEAELAVVIGEEARWVSEADALGKVFGYAVANDISARDWQQRESQFSRSKSMDTFCPIGPWIVTADQIDDPNDLAIRSYVNGELRQDSSTKQMIFDVPFLISYLSRTMTLKPGDVILTGTPHGVGFAMNPPKYLAPGDIVRCEIDGVGVIETAIKAPTEHSDASKDGATK
jgi:2-keto-4-pentenoate hydratase/2-oxohepta-3-ene-1,7-dioic acid hydratase in catechol pathway